LPCRRLSRPLTTTETPLPWGSLPLGNLAFRPRLTFSGWFRCPFRVLERVIDSPASSERAHDPSPVHGLRDARLPYRYPGSAGCFPLARRFLLAPIPLKGRVSPGWGLQTSAECLAVGEEISDLSSPTSFTERTLGFRQFCFHLAIRDSPVLRRSGFVVLRLS
jgi:hypothetical protein